MTHGHNHENEFVFRFGKTEVDGEELSKKSNAFCRSALWKNMLPSEVFQEIFSGGNIIYHSQRKEATSHARASGQSKDNVKYRAR